MIELVKAVGGIAWAIGLVFLFTEPAIALPILVFAFVATLYVRAKDREKKHRELLQATEKGHRPVTMQAPASVSERLAELGRLKDVGTITEEEYEAKRSERAFSTRSRVSFRSPPVADLPPGHWNVHQEVDKCRLPKVL